MYKLEFIIESFKLFYEGEFFILVVKIECKFLFLFTFIRLECEL